ncbi:hypothetical protein AB0L71_03455 [Streptomyces sp. NPDC052052]|uniref:hypothetical protein n=1 Tax=Streptomyces sp. NPDC052052 TaxID=3154756 RepID=UPI0034126C75
MAGFRSLARQVRDPRNDLALRRYSLRKCLERFAPYGHRATWDHLCARHGIEPEDRSPDPVRLLRVLDELEAARAVWLGHEAEFAERRRREKREGLRSPGTCDDWHRSVRGGCGVARCADPAVHPAAPLADVLGRLVAALESPPGTACPVCEGAGIVWRHDLTCEPWSGPVCTECGIMVPRAVLTPGTLAQARSGDHGLAPAA